MVSRSWRRPPRGRRPAGSFYGITGLWAELLRKVEKGTASRAGVLRALEWSAGVLDQLGIDNETPPEDLEFFVVDCEH